MLLFRSEETVAAWCQTHGVPLRPLIDLDQLWGLARAWYRDRLSVESRRPAPGEMVGIFAGLGLEGPFWDPAADRWQG